MGSVAVSATATVVVNPGAVSVSQSTLTATSPIAAGTGASTITVTAKDGFGNPIPGATVVLAATGLQNTLTQPSGPTNGDGVATGTLSSPVAESKTVSATINGTPISATATVVVQASTVSGAQSSLAATSPITAGSGTSTITVTARDALGNPVAGATVVLTATPTTGNTLTQPSTTTNGSGVATGTLSSTVAETKTVSATINGVAVSQTATVQVNAGPAAKIALTTEPSSTAQSGVALTQQPVVQLEDANNNPVSENNVTVTATVASGSPGATLATGVGGAATFSGLTISGPAGSYTLSFGSGTLTAATSGSITLNAASTATTITGHTPNPSVGGQAIAVTFTVSSSGGTPTGNVAVSAASDTCTGTVAAGTCNLTPSTAGAKTLVAVYAGNSDFNTSTSTGVSHTVNAATTTTAITGQTPNPSAVGQAVNFTFAVTANAPGGGTPTGTVTVSDGTQSCSATVAVGDCSIAFNSAGARTVTASYPGDDNYAASTATGVGHTVNQATTVTTITSVAPEPSTVGQATTVSFTVTSSSGTPTGTVTVSDGTEGCSGTVTAGSCSMTFTTAGAKTLTAAYGGDGSFAGSTSTGVGHTVNPAATTTAITGQTPNPSAVGQAVSFTFTVAANAPGSGTPTGTVTVSDGTESCNASVAVGSCSIAFNSAGAPSVTAAYAGDANYATSTSAPVTHTVGAASTTTAITGHTPSPSVVGQGIAVSYTVTSGGGAPTGDVTVSDGAATCTGTVAAGTCTLTPTTAGAKTLTASYAGNTNFAGSTSSPGTPHTVNPAVTTSTITAHAPDPSAVGQAVSFTFTVTANAPGSGTPTGTVTVSDGAQSCGASVAAGTCSITFNAAGGRSVPASYAGDGNYAASTSTPVTQTVGAASTTTAITGHTPNPSVVGQPIAVTFTVSGSGGTPTGNVTVSAGSDTCTGTVAAGTCNLTPTTAGAKTLVANYAGDANFGGSTSGGETQTVNAAATTTAITGQTPNPSAVGQAVNFTFAVTANAPGGGTPTGTVTVSDGTQSCSATVAVGDCSIAFSSAGARTVTASYPGDDNYAASTATGVGHTVNQATTVTTITSVAPEPSTVGQATTESFTVTSSSGTPTGTVTVSDGTEGCSGTVTAGSCSMTFTTAGAKPLTAAYGGDGSFAGSTSTGVGHTVNPAATTTAITGQTPNPSAVGQAVSFTFTVAANAPGSGTPTGTVTVSDGTESCNASVAVGSCSIAFNSAGAPSVTAAYAGDANYATSTSAPVTHTVGAAST